MSLRRRRKGFTLVEVLIALSLLSLLMLGLLASLGTFGRSGSRLEEQSQYLEELRLVSGFVRELVGGARSEERPPRDDGRQLPYFSGTGDELSWIGVMPARHGVGGLHWLRLSLRRHQGYQDLVLQFQPYFLPDVLVNKVELDWAALEPLTLARDVDSFRLYYQGLGEEEWVSEWQEEDVLPGWLRLEVVVQGKSWPLLQVQLHGADLRPEVRIGV